MIELTHFLSGDRTSLLVTDIQEIRDMGGEKTLVVMRHKLQGQYVQEAYADVLQVYLDAKRRGIQ